MLKLELELLIKNEICNLLTRGCIQAKIANRKKYIDILTHQSLKVKFINIDFLKN